MSTALSAVARVCHEANRAFCATIGDVSQPRWEDAPEWQQESAIKGVEFVADALARGDTLRPEASHESWTAEKERTGWAWGPVKDPEKKQHPCLVPYHELPPEQRKKDELFIAVATALLTGLA